MKKSLLFFLAIIFLSIFAFLPKIIALAQWPSFELYHSTCGGGVNCTPYPTITHYDVSQIGENIKITVTAIDVSGVYLITAKVADSQGNILSNNIILHPMGNPVDANCGLNNVSCNYVGTVDASSFSSGTYVVDVVTEDNLFNSSGQNYYDIGNFNQDSNTQELWTSVDKQKWSDYFNQNVDMEGLNPYNTHYVGSRIQFLIYADDLTSIGMQSGDKITSFWLQGAVNSIDDYLNNFNIRVKNTTSPLTTSWEGGWADFFSPQSVAISSLTPDNWKEYMTDSNGLTWTGGNIMVDISRRDDTVYHYDDDPGGDIWTRDTQSNDNRSFSGSCSYNIPCGVQSIASGNYGGFLTSGLVPALKVTYGSGTLENFTSISSFTFPLSATGGQTIILSATLEDKDGNPISGQTILFRNDTLNANIGSAVTNNSGVATVNYFIPPDIPENDNDTYNLKAIYSGTLRPSSSTKSISITPGQSNTTELWTDYPPYYSRKQYGDSSADPYNTYYTDSRIQFVISADELGSKINPGDKITSFWLKDALQSTDDYLKNFRIRVKFLPPEDTSSTSWEGGWTDFFEPTDISSSLCISESWQEYFGVAPLVWDGEQNIIVDISRSAGTYHTGDDPGGNMYVRDIGGADNSSFSGYCDNCDLPSAVGMYGSYYSDTVVPALKVTFMQ